jgi:hypothetical protein
MPITEKVVDLKEISNRLPLHLERKPAILADEGLPGRHNI